MTVPEIATKWALAGDGIIYCLVGTRSLPKLAETVRAAHDAFSPEIISRLNAATQPLLDTLGDGFDSYESRANDRTR